MILAITHQLDDSSFFHEFAIYHRLTYQERPLSAIWSLGDDRERFHSTI